MLQVQKSNYTNGLQLSIMTYNLLSSTEEIYPTPSFTREQILLFETTRYNPDIVCLQEVDDHYRWIERFAMFEYKMRVAHPNEFHSIAIFYKWDLFQEYDYEEVFFGDSDTGLVTEGEKSHQGALFMCLHFKPDFLEGHTPPSRHGIIVGTTHLLFKDYI